MLNERKSSSGLVLLPEHQWVSWASVEDEVAHYVMHEPGAASANLEPQGRGSGEPNPPRFPIGADYYIMMTAWSRFMTADLVMPYVCDPRRKGGIEQPSCLMVLRAAYGSQACRYDDQAPNGAKLLERARKAYRAAATVTPLWTRPKQNGRILARFTRHFGLEQ